MYIGSEKGEKGRVIVPHLNTVNVLTLLSLSYQRKLESVNWSPQTSVLVSATVHSSFVIWRWCWSLEVYRFCFVWCCFRGKLFVLGVFFKSMCSRTLVTFENKGGTWKIDLISIVIFM